MTYSDCSPDEALKINQKRWGWTDPLCYLTLRGLTYKTFAINVMFLSAWHLFLLKVKNRDNIILVGKINILSYTPFS